MGHLRATCPKLVRLYPFCDIECVHGPQRERELPEVKLSECVSADSCTLDVLKVKVAGANTCTDSVECSVIPHRMN